jgi:hypothetical protein
MDKFVLDQLLEKPKTYSRPKQFFYERPRKKFYHYVDKLLFLRIFKEVRKKLKRGNQFDVALEIKRIFTDANKKGTFDYLSESEFKYNFETNRKEYTPPTTEELELKNLLQLKLRESFLKEIGLTIKSLNYIYGSFSFSNLAEYYAHATPAAIVQMKKRSEKNRNF